MNAAKIVTVEGVKWTVHSNNERSATVNGRHLFAGRCNSAKPWQLREMDREAGAFARREIASHGQHITTKDLSRAALALTRYEHYRVSRTSLPSLGRAVLHVMSPGGIVEATFYGDQYRDRAEDLAAMLNAQGRAAA